MLNKPILIIGGLGEGKTSLAEYIVKKYGYKKLSMAGWLKRTVMEHYGISKIDKSMSFHGNSIRHILQVLGTEGCREADSMWHIDEIVKEIDILPNHRFVIDDIRFLNEHDVIKAWYNAETIRVTAHENKRIGRVFLRDGVSPDPINFTHKSETESSLIKCDFTLDNNDDLDTLFKNFDTLVKENKEVFYA